jgi:hypothetical protein
MDRVEADATAEGDIRRRDGILPRLLKALPTSKKNSSPPKSTAD